MNDKRVKVRLKPIDDDDIEMLRKWRNAYANEFFSAEYITKEMQRAWYDAYRQRESVDKMWIIYDASTNHPCGTIALYNISVPNRTAELGRVLLLDDYKEKGIMEEAINIVLDIAFEQMRLHKVRVFAYLDNINGLSLYEKTGFKAGNRPIILLEKVNYDLNWKEPITVSEYEGV